MAEPAPDKPPAWLLGLSGGSAGGAVEEPGEFLAVRLNVQFRVLGEP